MARPYKPTIPETLGELADQLGWMMLRSPRFEHEEFPGLDLEMVFVELGEGLNRLRRKLGEETFEALREMSG